MKKQSSIEWYENKLIQLDIDFGGHKNYWIERKKVREQAIAMHQDEIMNAFYDAQKAERFNDHISPKEYYNETFGGNNEK